MTSVEAEKRSMRSRWVMGSTEMVIGNGFHHLETKSCAEEIQDPSTLVTLVLELVAAGFCSQESLEQSA